MNRILLLVLFTTSINVYASEGCVKIAQEKIKEGRAALAVSSLVSGTVIAVAPPVGAVMLGLSATGSMAWSSRARYFIKLVKDAEKCSGRKLNNLYSKFLSVSKYHLGVNEFCEMILDGNKEGLFCSTWNDSIDAKKDIVESMAYRLEMEVNTNDEL